MNGSSHRARERWLLPLLLAIGLLHGISTAFVRPMFQVSDELAYFAAAQIHAVRQATTPDEEARLVAGSNRPIGEYIPTKPAYTRMAAGAYGAAARWAGPATALVLLRLWGCLALVFTVWMCRLLARELWPQNGLVVWGAPMVMALHPVFVITASGITPDTWANAAAALCLLQIVRATTGRAAAWEVVVLYVSLVLAIAMKDTAYALVACVAAAVPARLFLARRGHYLRAADAMFLLAPAAAPVAFFLPAARNALGTYYFSPAVREQVAATSPLVLGRDLVAAIAGQVPSYFRSFWGELGNFGATPLGLPSHVLVGLMLVCLGALAGLLAFIAVRPTWQPASTFTATRVRLVVVAVGCLVAVTLAPVRSLFGEVVDEAQGRWLFPMLAPLLVMGLAGLSWPMRHPVRALPLVSLLAATLALGALLAGVIPAYYTEFPSAYRPEQIFLAGSYGTGIELDRVLPFFKRPGWLKNPWIAWAPIVGLVVMVTAWMGRVARDASTGADGFRRGSSPETADERKPGAV